MEAVNNSKRQSHIEKIGREKEMLEVEYLEDWNILVGGQKTNNGRVCNNNSIQIILVQTLWESGYSFFLIFQFCVWGLRLVEVSMNLLCESVPPRQNETDVTTNSRRWLGKSSSRNWRHIEEGSEKWGSIYHRS